VEQLLGFLTEDVISLDLKATDRDGVIGELVDLLVEAGKVAAGDRDEIYAQIMEREGLGSTGIGQGFAIPHVKTCDRVSELVGAFGRSAEGIDFNAIDGEPCTLFFLMVSPEEGSASHLRILQKIAGVARNERFVRFLSEASDEAEVVSLLHEVAEG
jgi:mannitol/fructose-specific phosphotransferase system IIA component (Ntr-type)